MNARFIFKLLDFMSIKAAENNGIKFFEPEEGNVLIQSEQDALDLMQQAADQGTRKILIHAINLTPEFFDLKTLLAGNILQKFVTYRVQCAAVIPDAMIKGRFREMVIEANRGNYFRVFPTREGAVEWLTGAN
jgi:PadR family transcriptional regulator, regulatory protein AphA